MSSLAKDTPFFKRNGWHAQIWCDDADTPFPNDIWNQGYTKKGHGTILASNRMHSHDKYRVRGDELIWSSEILPVERKLVIRKIIILFVNESLKGVEVIKLNCLHLKPIFNISLYMHNRKNDFDQLKNNADG